LTNSAGDYFEGLTVDEAQQKVTIQSNRRDFPSALAAAVTNCVNNATYLGFAQDGVKVQGISGEQATEQVNGVDVKYWKITSELLCRQSGWSLLLPDVGFNYIDGGVKKRADVEGPDGEDHMVIHPVMFLALSYDHRIVDGHDAAVFARMDRPRQDATAGVERARRALRSGP
jgi:hypothetical protein